MGLAEYWRKVHDRPTQSEEHADGPIGDCPLSFALAPDGESQFKEYENLLIIQAKRLDEWHADMPLSERPIESFQGASRSQGTSVESALSIQPLSFLSHDTAMSYA
ncbi:hypothetical protein NUU61_002136 [Penicillium alfredii]|uniref:Uncharacterized protein n=1 Tax=Penicillium alfredii TaxID=1506179 RepID=A0A9W9KFP7_9EURO|nr:uncharacterized protein NUU61_002136 [Penicillium alfredii]KAJ5104789.1 hypothetical protein NUU61_002136 [Penicillium alfredii]